MSLSNSDSDNNDSSSSDDSFSITKRLLDEPLGDDSLISTKLTQSLVQVIAIQVPLVISTMSRVNKRPHGGSTIGRRYFHRYRKERHELIVKDYFCGEDSKYPPEYFRRRFQMNVELFNRILQEIANYDDYFTPKVDAIGRSGVSPLQKMVAAIQMLAYGCPAGFLDNYLQMGESTSIKSLKRFCDAVIGNFEEQYLRKPTKDDIVRLLKQGEDRGFPGMLGSIDCMHWHWKNCPTAWHGTHTNGFKRVPTLILEVVASQDLCIWHAFFGMAGTNNDINVLDRSPLFDDLINDVAPPCSFLIQGHQYNMGYYLSDGIYPPYASLVQTISQPSCPNERFFAERQEAVRKDVERAFGVLQSRWSIVKGPARMWNATDLGKIMKTCIILHNMIIESEHHQGINPENWKPDDKENIEKADLEHDYTFIVSKMINMMNNVRDTRVHKSLKTDLVNHLWEMSGNQQL